MTLRRLWACATLGAFLPAIAAPEPLKVGRAFDVIAELRLPPGYSLNPDAPTSIVFSFEPASAGQIASAVVAQTPGGGTASARAELATGTAALLAAGTVFFCSDSLGYCFVHAVRERRQLLNRTDGPAELRLPIEIQPRSVGSVRVAATPSATAGGRAPEDRPGEKSAAHGITR